MADKVIAIKIDVKGTSEQKKRLAQLEKGVKELTDERKRLNKALKDGTISLDEYSRELARVNTQLRGTRSQLNGARNEMLGLTSFTDRLNQGFSRLGNTVSTAFVGFFALQQINRLFTSSVEIIREFEQQMANVKAITGATEEEFQKLEKSAKDLGATTQFTAKEVAQLQEEYAKLGFTTQQILDASEATLELATATGSDLAQSAKVAAATINGFRLTAKDTQRIVDVMAKSFTSSALDLNKFETAMAAVAPVAATVGMSVEETTASLGVLVDAGFDASTAGTALRNILLDTQKAGISTAEAFEMIKNAADPTTAAFDLFGKRGAAVAITLANSTSKTADFTKELKNAQGAAAAMAKVVGDTLEGDVKRFNSAWEGLVLNLSENGQSAFRGITQLATDFVSTLSDMTRNVHAQSEAMEEQRIRMNALVQGITDVNTNEEERSRLINELNARYPKFLENLDTEKVTNEELRARLKEVNDELVNKIIIQRENEKIEEAANDLAEERIDRADEEIELRTKLNVINREYGLGLDLTNGSLEDNVKATQQAIAAQEASGAEFLKNTAIVVSLGNDLNSLSDAQEDVTESTEELNQAQNNKNEILKSLGINEADYTEKVKENTKATEENNKATAKSASNLANINEELEEIDIDIFDDDELDKQEVYFENLEGSFEGLNDLITKDDLDLTKQQQEQADKRVKDFANEAQRKLELERQFAEQVKSQQLDIAAQAAQGLVEISGRRLERQKTLELANLDARLEAGLISQEDFEKEREAIERKAFNKQKRLEIAQIAISLAREIASINATAAANPANALTFGAAGLSQAATLTALAVGRSAVQAGIVASQKFEDGGMISGASHANGGVPFTVDGVGGFEAEGGEAIINKRSTAMFAPLLSAINQAGGGVAFASPNISSTFARGGVMPSQSGVDMVDLENRITNAVVNSIGAIKVQNVATDTISEAVTVSNIQQEAQFG